MRIIITSILVFILAYAASALLELDFIAGNWVRYTITVLLIVFILILGFFIVKGMTKD